MAIRPEPASRAKRPACGPENEKSSRLATPRSKTSRCSGRASTDCTMCRSCTTAGSSAASTLARKSACFWLLPSRQTRSPASSTRSSKAPASAAATTFPVLSGAARARRASRLRAKVFQSRIRFSLYVAWPLCTPAEMRLVAHKPARTESFYIHSCGTCKRTVYAMPPTRRWRIQREDFHHGRYGLPARPAPMLNGEDLAMTVFGVALLAICTLVGVFIGDLLGVALGGKANVGGGGLALMMLVAARVWVGGQGGPCPRGKGECRRGRPRHDDADRRADLAGAPGRPLPRGQARGRVLGHDVHPHRGRHGGTAERGRGGARRSHRPDRRTGRRFSLLCLR